MSLIGLGQLQAVPQLKNQDPVYLTMLIGWADSIILDYLKVNIESTVYTDYYSGSERPSLVLRQKPVSAITAVYLDSQGYFGQGPAAFPAASLLTQGQDYALDIDDGSTLSKSGILLKLSSGQGTWVGLFPQAQNYPGKLSAYALPVWPRGQGNLKVIYTAGYAVVPQAVQGAAVMMTAWLARNTPAGSGLSTESLGGYSYSLSSGLMGSSPEMGSVKQILSRYRDPAF